MPRLALTLLATTALMVAAFPAGAQRADSSAALCRPTAAVVEGVYAGDSVTIGTQRVARTARLIRDAYPVRIDGSPFVAGERVVVVLDGRHLGTAVYDGCRLVPEWPGPWPSLDAGPAAVIEKPTATSGGYQMVHVTTAGRSR